MKLLLTVSHLIHLEQKDNIERIIWIDNQNTISFLIDIYANIYSPVSMNIDEIINCLNTKQAVILTEDPWAMVINEKELKERDMDKRDRAWKVISYIMDEYGEPAVFDAHKRIP